MEKFFNPESVVVIGVSSRWDNLGHGLLYNMKHFGYAGRVYAVGRRGGECQGVPICQSVAEIEDSIDLAVILTPAETVPDVVRECAQKGIKRIIIESSGFREYKDELRSLEDDILGTCAEHGLRFIGPNCIGTMNISRNMILHFAPQRVIPDRGSVGIVAQSGGITLWFTFLVCQEGQGLSKSAAVGNKLDVSEVDVLEYYINDPEVGAILMYLEGLCNGRRLFDDARMTSKPIVIYKSNAHPATAAIAHSHTAALLSDDRVVDAAFRQCGIWRAYDAEDVRLAVRAQVIKPMHGNRLLIISRSGGHAVMAADRAAMRGFELIEPPKEFFDRIAAIAPETRIYRQNPLDFGDVFDLELYDKIFAEGLNIGGIDGLAFLYLLTPLEIVDTSMAVIQRIAKMAQEADLPVSLGYFTQGQEIGPVKRLLPYPIFETPDQAIDALWFAREHALIKEKAQRNRSIPEISADRKTARHIIRKAPSGLLPADQAMDLIAAYGIGCPAYALAQSPEQAKAAALNVGCPAAMKIVSPDVIHKSDAGGVMLGIRNADDAAKAYTAMIDAVKAQVPAAEISGVLVQAMSPQGVELIVGAKRDDTFGPVALLGLGGIFAELLNKIVIRVWPFDRQDARDMIDELPGAAMLKGARGQKPVDLPALEDIILRTAALLAENPEIAEIDLNPVMALPEAAWAVDARIIIKHV